MGLKNACRIFLCKHFFSICYPENLFLGINSIIFRKSFGILACFYVYLFYFSCKGHINAVFIFSDGTPVSSRDRPFVVCRLAVTMFGVDSQMTLELKSGLCLEN